MKNKFFKSITFVIAIAMLMSMVPAVVSADAMISDVNVVVVNDEVTVTATVSGLDEYTLLAVRDSAAYDGVDDIPSEEADLELQVEYIDQRNDIADGKIEFTFPLRDRVGDLAMESTDRFINVFIGGAGADAQVDSYAKKYDAPKLAVEDLKEKYYSEDEAVTVTIEFADDTLKALWESKELVAKIGDEELADVNWENLASGYISIPAASFAEEAYTDAVITIAEVAAEGEEAEFEVAKTDKVSFAIASRVEEAKAAIVALKAVDNDDDETATITIPVIEPVAGVEISYDIITEGYEAVDGVITVTKPGEDEDAITIAYKVVLTYDDEVVYEEEKAVSVQPVGVAIAAENITVLKASAAYGVAANALVKVTVGADIVDPATNGIDGLYYSPQKEAFYGIVDKTLAADKDELAATLSGVITDGAAETFYFGVVATTGQNPNVRDFGFAGRATKGTENPTAKQYIALDVNDAEPNGLYDVRDFGAHGRKTKGTNFPVLAQ